MDNKFQIYLDMDGVLAEFDDEYRNKAKIDYKKQLSQKEFNTHWEFFIRNNGFKNLALHHTATELLNFIKSLNNTNVEILGSLGGEKFQMEVISQKREWLSVQNIWYKQNFVVKRQEKKNFAKKWAVLIDDHPDNVREFTEAGGTGILHVSAVDTIEKLNMHYRHWEIIMDGRLSNIELPKVNTSWVST